MRRLTVWAVLALALPATAFGYAWDARYSSNGANWDRASAVVTDAAGNAYVTGFVSEPATGRDFMTIKYNPAGDTVWTRRFGGTGEDEATALVYDAAGYLYVTGYSTGASADFLTIKYNAATGDTVWTRRYNGPAATEDRAVGIRTDNLGYVYVAGYAGVASHSEAVVVKYASAGGLVWTRLVPSPNGDGTSAASALYLSTTRTPYICGRTRDSRGQDDILVARISEAGALDWQRQYDGTGLENDRAFALAVDDSGNVVAAGQSWGGAATEYDYLVIKYSAAGDLRWSNRYDGTAHGEDTPAAIALDAAYNAYVTGYSTSNNDEDYFTVKYSPTGTRVWTARYNGQGAGVDNATALALRGTTLYVTGFSDRANDPEATTIGYSTDGAQLWVTRYLYEPNSDDDEAFAIAFAGDGVFYIAGESFGGPATATDMLTVKYMERDLGALTAQYPADTLTPRPLAPVARVRNHGVDTETAAVYLTIHRGGSPVYRDVQTITGLAAEAELDVTFKTFAGGEGDYVMRCSTALAGDQDPANDTASGTFTFRWTTLPYWLQRDNVPPGPAAKMVKDGGALCYGRHNATQFSVFALKGNGTNEFYRFDVAGDSWCRLETLLFAARRRAVKKGAALAYDRYDTLVFALKGNNSFEFWKYDVIKDTWMPAESVPEGVNRKKVKGGAGLAFYHNQPSASDYVYAMKGNKTTEFYAYYVQGDTWLPKETLPRSARGKGMVDGSCLVNAGGTLYALRGTYNEFFAYDIGSDTWTVRASLPFYGRTGRSRKAKWGSALAYGNGVIYCLKGGYREFWGYYVDADTWVELESIPGIPSGKAVKGGGALTYGNATAWALKGNKSYEFFSYALGTDMAGGFCERRDGAAVASRLSIDDCRLTITPNPIAGGYATLRYTLPTSGPVSVSVFDVAGRSVYSKSTIGHPTATMPLDLRELPAGVYLVRVAGDGFSAAEKLVIQR